MANWTEVGLSDEVPIPVQRYPGGGPRIERLREFKVEHSYGYGSIDAEPHGLAVVLYGQELLIPWHQVRYVRRYNI